MEPHTGHVEKKFVKVKCGLILSDLGHAPCVSSHLVGWNVTKGKDIKQGIVDAVSCLLSKGSY